MRPLVVKIRSDQSIVQHNADVATVARVAHYSGQEGVARTRSRHVTLKRAPHVLPQVDALQGREIWFDPVVMERDASEHRGQKHESGKESDSLKGVPGTGVTFFGKKS
jgi:hypothetical protein